MLLIQDAVLPMTDTVGIEFVTFAIRQVLEQVRQNVLRGQAVSPMDEILDEVGRLVRLVSGPSLKPIVNGTGIVLHTNLARAPLGPAVASDLQPIVTGYSNLELDCKTGRRGSRNEHVRELVKFLTHAEDAIVVNNNAAGVFLALKVLADDHEVIISRGELIEIGGSFRMPDIMAACGARMVEVGTTNRTRLADYENAITPETRILFKAHRSNYTISGFTEEVETRQLAELAKAHNLVFVYDIGSGLLRKPPGLPLQNEPDVRQAMESGVDIITFSCDKLLGGPQAGVVAGRRDLVARIAKAPLMRTYRVGKLTIAALSTVLRCYLKEDDLFAKIPIFTILKESRNDRRKRAETLSEQMMRVDVQTKVVESTGHCGGGTLPDLAIDSYAVMPIISAAGKMSSELLYRNLLHLDRPVLGILREGNLLFDVLCIVDDEIPWIVEALASPTARN